ncbi:transcription termination factor 1, mitochondrial isoform 5-T6 [Megaptera novaeangliae]
MCLGSSVDENHIGSADEFWSFRTDTGIKLASFNCLCSSSSNGVITSLFMCPKGNLESEVREFNEEEQTFEFWKPEF